MEFSQIYRIKSRFPNSNRLDILPNRIQSESGGTGESLFTQIGKLERQINEIL